jgi:hypothetical protein
MTSPMMGLSGQTVWSELNLIFGEVLFLKEKGLLALHGFKKRILSLKFYGGVSISDGYSNLVSNIRTISPIGTGIIVKRVIMIRTIKGATLKIFSKVNSIFKFFLVKTMR